MNDKSEKAKAEQATDAVLDSVTGKVKSCVGDCDSSAVPREHPLRSLDSDADSVSTPLSSDGVARLRAVLSPISSAGATGYLTGDQAKQTKGNVQAEDAQWSWKQATSDNALSIPHPSQEGIEGKGPECRGDGDGRPGTAERGECEG